MAASSLEAIGCWAAGIYLFQFWLRSLLSCAWKIGSVSCVIHQNVLRSKILFWCSSCSSDSSFHCLVPLEVSWDAFFSTIDVTYRTFFMKFWIFSFGCLPLVLFLSPMIITAEASVISKACYIMFLIRSVHKFLNLDRRGGVGLRSKLKLSSRSRMLHWLCHCRLIFCIFNWKRSGRKVAFFNWFWM